MDNIEKIFKERKEKSIFNLRRSAVVIPIIEEEGKQAILFEVRSAKLKSQPLDICLPGGKVEPSENYKETAGRELMEELLIKDSDFEIIAPMDYLVTPYRGVMHPFVAKIKQYSFTYNEDEVESVFKVPLEFFKNNDPLRYDLSISPVLKEDFPYHLINGGKNYPFATVTMPQYFYEYEGHVIWGSTALIVKAFIDIIKEVGFNQ
ncbi:CoA pyrophosphatase [Clostridium sp. 19966]|uniref:NUDIX hydrolase n=1 Tax=Clostridium sp. 19966 TaxID=2768166 RepID=UPI0028DFB0D4|nr:CoA pyrophosphatase [Clostridium sp. 19966]MDT8718743.1 CoA pyrophosphatase [Clostridium sp. 19966]